MPERAEELEPVLEGDPHLRVASALGREIREVWLDLIFPLIDVECHVEGMRAAGEVEDHLLILIARRDARVLQLDAGRCLEFGSRLDRRLDRGARAGQDIERRAGITARKLQRGACARRQPS